MPVKKIFLLAAFLSQSVLITTSALASDANKKVEMEATAMDNAKYAIQVASYQDAKEADKHIAVLKNYGLAAVSSHEAVEGRGMWYRIYIGRYNTKQEAIAAASKLEADGIISGYWIRVLKETETPPLLLVPDRAEQAVAEKVETSVYTEPPAPAGRPVEPQASPEAQVTDRSPQLHAESSSAGIIEPSEENAGEPVEEILSEAPTPEIEFNDENTFSVSLRPGIAYFHNLGEFTISSPTKHWYFVKKYPTVTIVPSFDFNESFSLEGSFGKILDAKFDSWYATLGPKFTLITSSNEDLLNFSPYIRGALMVGDMSWDDVPGNFDTRMGWELGVGTEVVKIRSNLRLGLDMSYRSAEIGYNAPSNSGVTSSQSEIDFSSFSFASFMKYSF